MIEQHSGEITSNITAHGRHWSEIEQHLSQMPEWAEWCLNHPGVLRAGTIKLTRQEDAEKLDEAATREEIFARVARTIEFARLQALANDGLKEQRENLKKQLAELKADLKKSPAGREPTGPLTFAGQKRQHDDKGQDLERQLGDLTDQLTRLAYPPVTLLVAPTGSRKSTLMRAAAVQYVTERPEKTVVILMPRHKLGDEQVEMLRREHPDGNYSAAVWRGRHAWDPHVGNGHEQQMCRREVDAALVEEAVLDVEGSLCKQGRGKKAIKCPFYVDCAFQGQKQIKANIWFAAHECAVYEMPKAFGDVGWVIFDESPLDAFMSGVDLNDQVTLELDTLSTPLPVDQKPFVGNYNKLMLGRKVLYHALAKLPVPIESHLGAPALRMNLDQFIKPPGGGNGLYASEMHGLTWRGKVEPDIRPDLTGEQLKARLQEAAGNSTIKKEVWLWELVGRVADNKVNAGTKKQIAPGVTVTWRSGRRVTPEEFIQRIKAMNPSYGCIQTHRGKEGRIIRMVGMKPFTEGWDMPTLICDATGDAELLRPIWLQLAESEPHGWEQLPRPDNVQIFQCVNRPISKGAVGVEGKDEKDQKADSARRLYAAVLRKALEYGGQDIGVIVYKSTKDWILKNCFVPDWIKLLHWGDLTGTNALQKVRALFVIGRPLGAGETVTRQAEALFSDYIADRGYRKQLKGGRIPIVPDAAGNNVILVDVWEHPDPRAERLRRQITEGSLIQAVGRARAGLRKQDEPLDIHLWTDVPLPELGPVEPVLWAELDAGLDGLMLAKEGVWLRNIADAAQGFNGLIPAAGLKKARAAGARTSYFLYRYIYRESNHSSGPNREHGQKCRCACVLPAR